MKTFVWATWCLLFGWSTAHAEPYKAVFKTAGSFEDIFSLVQSSIEGRGLRINHVNQIAGMLDRTGAAVGSTRKVYGEARQFEFCSAQISRAMMETSPEALVMCPYIISVYTVPGDPAVYVAYRKPPVTGDALLDAALNDVDKLLRGIIRDAIQ
jgi:uncharacterized protein (DUF302 family)